MKKKNLLLVCLSVKDINKIFKLELFNYERVIVASDDLRVHEKIKKLDSIDEVIFLQKSISYPKVLDSVVGMIDNVNLFFDKVAKEGIFTKKVIFWTYHVESGDSQILQDLLIAIDSAYLIFDDYMISELITIGNENNLIIKILKKIAFKKGYKISSYSNKFYLDKNKIKNYLKPIYFFFRSLFFKTTSTKPNHSNERKIILFQVHGSNAKNTDNVLFSQNEFSKNGFTPLNILWGSTKAVKKINKIGYKAIAIEFYLKYKDIFFSFWNLLSILRKVNSLKNLFYQTSTFTYKGVEIQDVVFENILKYLYIDGPENYKYRLAAERFVFEYSKNIVAIKYSAAKFINQGTILSEIMKDKYLKFDYDLGLRTSSPFTKYISEKHHKFLTNNFIRLSPNEIEKKHIVEDINVSEDSVVIFGAGRLIKHFEKKNLVTKEESMKEIGIKKDYEIYVFLPFSNPLPGYASAEEVYYVLNTLVEFAKIHKNIAVIIKPNYSADLSYLSDIIFKKYDNIYILDKNVPPDHVLNITDIVFCKISTLGKEAMIYDQQVVSTLFDNEKIFKVFGDAAHYIYTKEELSFFLEKTLYSKATFIQWKNSFKEKRKFFMKENFPKLEKNTEKIIVETIKKKLKY